MKKYLLAVAVLLAVLLARDSEAQGCFGPGCGGSGSSGSSTITSGTTATSGCVAGGVLRSISNMVECGAGITWSGGTLTLNNGASAVSPLVVQDNGSAVFTIADGGAATLQGAGLKVRVADSFTDIIRAERTSDSLQTFGITTATTLTTMTLGYASGAIKTAGGAGSVDLITTGYGDVGWTTTNGGLRIAGGGYISTPDTSLGQLFMGTGTAMTLYANATTFARAYLAGGTFIGNTAGRTLTNAATLNIASAPTQGANITISNLYALNVEAGMSRFAGGVRWATGAKPTCDAAARGTTWYVAGAGGVADTFEMCGKSAADAYSWVALATF